jgi:hypothetical protein
MKLLKKVIAVVAVVFFISATLTSCKTGGGAHCAAYASTSTPNTNVN